MLIGGIIALVIGIGLVIWHVFARRKAGELKVARAMRVSNLVDLSARMASELGEGGLTEFVELVGAPKSPQPLTSPLGERPCLYYKMTVKRQYEEEHTTRDSEGREKRETRRGSEVMSTESDACDFDLDDGSGLIRVRIHGADYDGLVETVDRFEPAHDGGSLRMGRWSFSVGILGGGRRTLGYQYEEHVLPFGPQLTVIGQASDAGGGLGVGSGGLRYIVSTRSKSDIIGSAERVSTFTAIGSGLCLLAGVGLIIAHLVS